MQLKLAFQGGVNIPPGPADWFERLREKVATLVERPYLVRSIMLIETHQSTPEGYEAEQALAFALKDRFGRIPWNRPPRGAGTSLGASTTWHAAPRACAKGEGLAISTATRGGRVEPASVRARNTQPRRDLALTGVFLARTGSPCEARGALHGAM